MPSEKTLSEKQKLVAELAEKLSGCVGGVLVEYKGINVAADTVMRRELREAGVEYSVVKNTMLNLAAQKAGLDQLSEVLSGTTALAVSKGDPVICAKLLTKYAAQMQRTGFAVKAGFVEGRVIDAAGVEALAKLPAREVLIAKVLGGFNAPISGFVNVLNGNLRGLVVALSAIAEKKAEVA